jgi:hypothetical protein
MCCLKISRPATLWIMSAGSSNGCAGNWSDTKSGRSVRGHPGNAEGIIRDLLRFKDPG